MLDDDRSLKMSQLPTLYIPHGGGPWPWMAGSRSQHASLERYLSILPSRLPERPRTILMVSAHWEETVPTLMSSERPGMLYDYGGFPPHTYEVRYPAPGAPTLVPRVQELLQRAGHAVRLDSDRGYDHGTFVPLALMWPKADIPILQLSLLRGLDPAAHLALGRALAPLRNEGVLIVGSGSSFHNMALISNPARGPYSAAFDAWLQATVAGQVSAERSKALEAWASAPAAHHAHAREEHLLPLMVAVGAAEGKPGLCNYHEPAFLGDIAISGFWIGDAPR